MKIGIITFVNEDNYGAVLQAYAMQSFLRKRKIESEFVNIRLSNFVKNDNGLLRNLLIKAVFYRKKRNFQKFRKCLDISKNKDCFSLDEYDAIIIGSDQVWNPLLTGNKLQPVFFGEKFNGNVIGYACSCGNTIVLEDKLDEIKRYLANFNYISVRENSLKNFLKNKISKEVSAVLDPVFLLENIEWKHFVEDLDIKISEPYIFVYLLENDDAITEAINKISNDEKMGVVTLRTAKHYRDEIRRFPGADPKEFLALLANADIVITNSFHAVAFSYIFRKKVALFKHSQFNERINDLIKLIGLDENVYYSESKNVIDFSCIEKVDKMYDKREFSKEFLEKAILEN